MELHGWLAINSNVSVWRLLVTFLLGAFFGYVGLLVFLEFYETQRRGSRAEDRRSIQKLITRSALCGAFVTGVVAVGLYLSS